MKRIEILSVAYLYVLLMSFVPLLVKGMLHVQGGSYVPMIVINLLGIPIICGLYYGKSWVTLFIRIWSVWMILYGIMRIGLQGLVAFTNISVEASILNQMSSGYLMMSVLHLLIGWALYRFLYSCIWVASSEKQLAL